VLAAHTARERPRLPGGRGKVSHGGQWLDHIANHALICARILGDEQVVE
jgi:hypothetical protein